ncbi:hypothetical protein TWF106_001128 [Orbilia oligospora]|uniref:F-box domain-containing protein n=1 Tax=Orbilia oligospora TaxID=2813651 RepID=A0A7C8QB60_ORBOL|nr:hypothetical protein TWF106_001128 [Orbilia oligospora]
MEPTTKHSPIHSLPPELLTSILTHLTRQETYPLLFVSKYFHSTSLPKIWHTLSTIPEERFVRPGQPMKCIGLRKLVSNSKEFGIRFETIEGFKHVKEIRFNGPEDLEDNAAWITTGLLEFVTKLIETRGVNLVRLEIDKINARGITMNGDRIVDTKIRSFENFPIMCNFLKSLKHHSTATISLQFINPRYKDIGFPLEFFNPNHITTLDITHSDTWGKYPHPKESVIRNITNLISILSQTSSLKILKLFLAYPLEEEEEEEGTNQDLETTFQNTISSLSRLEVLNIYYAIFTPSFFLHPPESTKSLIITQHTSLTWWTKLSKYSSNHLETLMIFTPQGTKRKVFLPFSIKRLELKSLKTFSMGWDEGPAPRDFFDLLYANNPGLGEDPKKLQRQLKLKLEEQMERDADADADADEDEDGDDDWE